MPPGPKRRPKREPSSTEDSDEEKGTTNKRGKRTEKRQSPSQPKTQAHPHHQLDMTIFSATGDVTASGDIGFYGMPDLSKAYSAMPTTAKASTSLKFTGTNMGKNVNTRNLVVDMSADSSRRNPPSTQSASSAPRAGPSSSSSSSTGLQEKRPYSDLSSGKGNVLIINNMFTGQDGYERPGSEKDANDMKELFDNDLDCIVERKENVTSVQLRRHLNKFKKACDDAESSFLVVIVMTHGGSGDALLMHDQVEVNLFNDIIYKFKEDAFPVFSGKPKIFLVQACDNYEPLQHDAIEPPGVGELADTFVGRACLPFGAAWRRPDQGHDQGGWYIQSIKDVFRNHWEDEDLQTMHNRVRDSVVEKAREENARRLQNEQRFYQTPYNTCYQFGTFMFPRHPPQDQDEDEDV